MTTSQMTAVVWSVSGQANIDVIGVLFDISFFKVLVVKHENQCDLGVHIAWRERWGHMESEIDHQPNGRSGLVSLGQVKHDISVKFETTPRLALRARDKELERTESP